MQREGLERNQVIDTSPGQDSEWGEDMLKIFLPEYFHVAMATDLMRKGLKGGAENGSN